MTKLRNYQQECVKACLSSDGGLCILPQGSGKSHIIAELCAQLYIYGKILIVTPRVELVKQNRKIIDATLFKKTVPFIAQPQVCTINLAHTRKFSNYSMIIIDECHLVGRDMDSMYQKLIARSPDVVVYGFTATPYRIDLGHLVPKVFSKILYEVGRSILVGSNFLVKRRYVEVAPEMIINIKSINYVSVKKLSKEVVPQTSNCIKDFLLRKGVNEKSIIFGCDITHCEKIKGLIPTSEVIHSRLPKHQNDKIISEFISGKIKTLINCEMLTLGFDCPDIDNVVILRPTDSYALYAQMIGRGDRPAPFKSKNNIYDYTLNAFNFNEKSCTASVEKEKHCIFCHELTDYRLSKCRHCKKGLIKGETPQKKCIYCGELNFNVVTYCKSCGEFIRGSIYLVKPYKFGATLLRNGAYSVRFVVDGDKERIFVMSGELFNKVLKLCAPQRISVATDYLGEKRYGYFSKKLSLLYKRKGRSKNFQLLRII